MQVAVELGKDARHGLRPSRSDRDVERTNTGLAGDMNCEKCPNYALVEKARRACLACGIAEDGREKERSHHGRSHVRATDFTLSKSIESREPSGYCTRLSPADEDRLRTAMTTLFGLDDIDLLLIRHLFNGGKLADFGVAFDGLVRRARRYHGNVRAMAHARKDAIISKFPLIKPVFKHLIVNIDEVRQDPDSIDNLL